MDAHAGDILTYMQMCMIEKANLQRGMNYRFAGRDYSIILMSVRDNSPYDDEILEGGRIIIYEGHDVSKTDAQDPKSVDQPMVTDSGRLTQNGHFWTAATEFKAGKRTAERVRVYEKIKAGIWVYNGVFELVDAWLQQQDKRQVFRFKLCSVEDLDQASKASHTEIEHTRVIPSSVKKEVWLRDGGKCVHCGRTDNLHFDHVIPFSKGGTSLSAANIQLLCMNCNLSKRDKIE